MLVTFHKLNSYQLHLCLLQWYVYCTYVFELLYDKLLQANATIESVDTSDALVGWYLY